MALPKQAVDIPLNGGMDLTQGYAQVRPPSFSTLQNAQFTRDGGVQIRAPFIATPDNETDPAVINSSDGEYTYALAKNGDALLARGAKKGFYQYSAGRDIWSEPEPMDGGEVPPYMPVGVRRRALQHCELAVTADSVRTAAGITGVVRTGLDGGSTFDQVEVSFVDADGARVGGPVRLGYSGVTSFLVCRIVALGGTVVVLAKSDGGTNGIFAWTCDTSAAAISWSAGTQLVSGGTMYLFDAATNDAGDEFILFNGQSTSVYLRRFNASLVQQGSTASATGTAFLTASVVVSGSRVLGLFSTTGGDLKAVSMDDTLTTTHFGVTTVSALLGAGINVATAAIDDTGDWQVWWSETADASDSYMTRTRNVSTSGSVSGRSVEQHYFTTIIGHAANFNGRVVVPCAWADGSFSDDFQEPLLGMLLTKYGDDGDEYLGCLARYAVDRSGPALGNVPPVHTTVIGDELSFVWFDKGAGGQQWNYLTLVDHTITAPGGPRGFVEHDGVTYFGGGQLWAYDGTRLQENSPHIFPTKPTVAFTGSGDLSAGDYSYKVVCEWEDARGVLRRSAPSAASTGTATAGQRCRVSFPFLPISSFDGFHAPPTRVAIYRTEAGGSVHKLAKRTKLTALAPNGMGYVDDGSTTDDELGEVLYTEGGALANYAPPPVHALAKHANRLFIVSADRQDEVHYSQKLRSAIAPEFNPALLIKCPENIEAIAGLDDKLLLFGKDKIWAVYGDGPNDNGGGGSFSEPQLVSPDSGCVARDTAVTFRGGIMYRSRRGFEMIDRGMQVSYPGIAIPTSATQDVKYGVLVPGRDEIHFGTDATTREIIVFDYVFGRWTYWKNETGLDPEHAIVVGTKLYLSSGTAGVFELNESGLGADGQGDVKFIAETGWIPFNTLQGYQRIKKALFMFDGMVFQDVSVYVGFDYSTDWTLLQTRTAAELTALPQVSKRMPTEKCEALRFKVETTNNFGWWNGLTLEGGVKRGVMRFGGSGRA